MFINNLKSGDVEFNNLKSVLGWDKAIENKKENIYFLCGVREGVDGRASDKDIVSKKYCCIDLDIRNQFKGVLNDEDIVSIGKDIKTSLEGNLGGYRYIIFSGNGLHIYYTFNEISGEDLKYYSYGVKELFREWDEFWGDDIFNSDKACCNLARILRLPGSINQKNGSEVKIIDYQDVDCKFDIVEMGKKKIEEEKMEVEKRQKEFEEKMKEYDNGNDNNIYGKILSIPAYDIAQMLVPDFPYDGKKNFKNKVGGFTGYFYNSSTNTICNGGSRYFNWGNVESCWDSFGLVKNFHNFSNKETFLFFKKIMK